MENNLDGRDQISEPVPNFFPFPLFYAKRDTDQQTLLSCRIKLRLNLGRVQADIMHHNRWVGGWTTK